MKHLLKFENKFLNKKNYLRNKVIVKIKLINIVLGRYISISNLVFLKRLVLSDLLFFFLQTINIFTDTVKICRFIY